MDDIYTMTNEFYSGAGYQTGLYNNPIYVGTTDIPVIKLSVMQVGMMAPLMEFDNVTFSTTNASYVSGAKLFYSDEDDFSNATEVATLTSPTGSE